MGPLDAPAILRVDRDSGVRELAARGAGAFQKIDPAFQEVFLEHRRHLGIAMRQHVMAAHKQRHPRPEAGEDVNHLDTGHSGLHDDQVLGKLGQVVGVPGGQYSHSVDRRPRWGSRPRPGGEQRGVEGDFDDTVTRLDHRGVRTGQGHRSANDLDALGIEHFGDATLYRPGHRVEMRGKPPHIQLNVARVRDSQP